MTSDAQRKANQNQDATRSGNRVAIWYDRDSPEDKAVRRIMRKQRLTKRIDALRWLIAQTERPPEDTQTERGEG